MVVPTAKFGPARWGGITTVKDGVVWPTSPAVFSDGPEVVAREVVLLMFFQFFAPYQARTSVGPRY